MTLSFSLSFEFYLSHIFIFQVLHFMLSEFPLYFSSWSSVSFLLSLRNQHAIPRWAVGMGFLRQALDVVSGAAWTPGSGGYAPSVSLSLFIQQPACDVLILSVCDAPHCSHTHTHTQRLVLTRPPPVCPALVSAGPGQSWTLPGRCPRALCGTVTQTGSSGSSKAFSGTLAQR